MPNSATKPFAIRFQQYLIFLFLITEKLKKFNLKECQIYHERFLILSIRYHFLYFLIPYLLITKNSPLTLILIEN